MMVIYLCVRSFRQSTRWRRNNERSFLLKKNRDSYILQCVLTSILSNLNNFHSLEVVDRVSETQVQVGENSK